VQQFDIKHAKDPVVMALKLERGDLLQLQPISATGTLKLLPLGKKNKVKRRLEILNTFLLLNAFFSFVTAKTCYW